jgi:hypothetical protein
LAERPVFVPLGEGPRTVAEVPVNFTWHPGMAASQKKKNVVELHAAAAERGIKRLLEISTKSEREVGQRLSAFNQRLELSDGSFPLENVYQASKVFAAGGPYIDLLRVAPRDAKRDVRLIQSGHLIAFELEGERYPLNPPTAFYDWLYMRCLYPHRDWLRRLAKVDGFTDIEFNPARSLNCQARACASFVALEKRALLDDAMRSFPAFLAVQSGGL